MSCRRPCVSADVERAHVPPGAFPPGPAHAPPGPIKQQGLVPRLPSRGRLGSPPFPHGRGRRRERRRRLEERDYRRPDPSGKERQHASGTRRREAPFSASSVSVWQPVLVGPTPRVLSAGGMSRWRRGVGERRSHAYPTEAGRRLPAVITQLRATGVPTPQPPRLASVKGERSCSFKTL